MAETGERLDVRQIGARVRGERLAKGWSQGDMERRTGILRCYQSRIENGHVIPSIEILERIARALEIPLAQFFTDELAKIDVAAMKLTGEDLQFLLQVRRASVGLTARQRQLLLETVRELASGPAGATAPPERARPAL